MKNVPFWIAGFVLWAAMTAPALSDDKPGVVCNVKVLSDKVKDVSSLEAWKKSFLKDGMSDKDKALAIWESVVTHQHQDGPPCEFVQNENLVLDPIKIWNVYGYSFCGVAASEVESLARYVGLEARGWTIVGHVVPEVKWNNAWHLLDASLINYFPKPDGDIASVDEISKAVQDWLKEHPEYKGSDKKLREFHFAEAKKGWKKGPSLLAECPFYTENGWWPAKTHGWYSTMQEYDGSTHFEYENGYSNSYKVNIQLRPGEKLVRNWSNKGLTVNMTFDAEGKPVVDPATKKVLGQPGCAEMKTGEQSLLYTPKYGDLAPGRVGNGTLEYVVPVGDAALKASAWTYENLKVAQFKGQAVIGPPDASKPGVLTIRMPSSYLYLTGQIVLTPEFDKADSKIVVSLSDNNGLDWKPVATIDQKKPQADDPRVKLEAKSGGAFDGPFVLNVSPLVFRRYDYLVKFEMVKTALCGLTITHDIQHSQRPLPAMDKGDNTITFSAGPDEGTVVVEGSTDPASKDKQLMYTDFHPVIVDMNGRYPKGPKGSLTFPITTPGDIVRLRMGCFWIGGDPGDGWDMEVSYDGGKTFKTVEAFGKSVKYNCRYKEVADVSTGTKEVQFRMSGSQKSVAPLLNVYCCADYKQPGAGFRPVKVTYVWEEDGKEKSNIHVAAKPADTWTIKCETKPVMKSITLELAE